MHTAPNAHQFHPSSLQPERRETSLVLRGTRSNPIVTVALSCQSDLGAHKGDSGFCGDFGLAIWLSRPEEAVRARGR